MREGEIGGRQRSSAGTSATATCTTSSCCAAVQERCGFAPGELRVVMLESQPIHRSAPALPHRRRGDRPGRGGPRGRADMVVRQPWLDETDRPAIPVERPPTATATGDRRRRPHMSDAIVVGGRAQRAGRRRRPGAGRGRGHRAGGGRHDRRRHPEQRADRARAAARPLLGRSTRWASARRSCARSAWSGTAWVALARGRPGPSARRRRGPGCWSARWSGPCAGLGVGRPGLGAAVRPAHRRTSTRWPRSCCGRSSTCPRHPVRAGPVRAPGARSRPRGWPGAGDRAEARALFARGGGARVPSADAAHHVPRSG